jgi:hypothetical protein
VLLLYPPQDKARVEFAEDATPNIVKVRLPNEVHVDVVAIVAYQTDDWGAPDPTAPPSNSPRVELPAPPQSFFSSIIVPNVVQVPVVAKVV